MNFLRSLFSKPSVSCPRCLGKGFVDWEDIQRLKMELKWKPGRCAYCGGTGTVEPDMESKIAPNTTYLTIDLDEDERKRLLQHDRGALQRAAWHEQRIDDFLKQVRYLHAVGHMDAGQIAEFYLLPNQEAATPAEDREALIDYIGRILAHADRP